MKRNFIAIEGNIGAGKTTLAKMLAEHWNARLLLEEFADNPFLEKFYENPGRHAFSVELYFLADRYHQLRAELSSPSLFQNQVVSDYFIAKSLIFAGNNLVEDEYGLFHRLFEIMFSNVPRPDLLVYLFMDVERLQDNIRKRGRSYEQQIPADYLMQVQQRYLHFIRNQNDLTVLLVDINDIDFVQNRKDFYILLDILNRDYETGVHTITAKSDIIG